MADPTVEDYQKAIAAKQAEPTADDYLKAIAAKQDEDPLAGVKTATIDSAPMAGTMVGQTVGAPLGPVGEIIGGAVGNVGGNIAKTAMDDYREGGWKQVLRPPTVS